MALVPIVLGSIFVIMGLIVISEPKFKLFRDVGITESEEVGKVERIAARLVGLFIIFGGFCFIYIGI